MSADEQRIAAGDEHGNVILWDAQSGKKPWPPVKIHEGLVDGLAFSPDGRLIASCGGNDGTLVVIDANSGHTKFRLPRFKGWARKVMFSPDGRWIADRTEGDHAMLIDAATGEVATKFPGEKENILPTFDPSGHRIATAGRNGTIKLWGWDGSQLRQISSWYAGEGRIKSLSFSADGTRLVSTAIHRNVNTVWNATTGEPIDAFESRDHVYWSAFSPSGDEVALFSVSGGIRIWRYDAREHGRAIKPLDGAAEVAFSPDASRILASTPMYYDAAGLVHRTRPYYPLEHAIILDAEFGNMVGTTSEAIYAASWSPDGREIIATPASGDGIRAYDVGNR